MSRNLNNIHDRFVKQLLSSKDLSVEFLKEYLPPEVASLINFETLTYQNTSYLSGDLKSSFSDMVWQVKINSGKNLRICLLLEHKSYVDPRAAFQILEYLALAYQRQLSEKKKPELIIPVLYYHGKRKWNYQSFESYFSVTPEHLKKYLPRYESIFINLQQMSPDQLQNLRNGLLKSAIMLQKYYFDPESLNQNVFRILESLNPYLESKIVDAIFVYLIQNRHLRHGQFRESLKTFSPALNAKIMSIYNQLINDGIEKGLEQGIEKGLERAILNAFDNGYDISAIRVITGESSEKIKAALIRNNRKPDIQ